MATLTQLTLDGDGTIGAVIEHDAGTGSPFNTHCNDAPDGVSTDWVANDTTETTGDAFFSLSNVNADFGSMDTLNIDVDLQVTGTVDDDTGLIRATIFDANSTSNALTSTTATLGDQTDTTRGQRNVSFAGLTGSKAQWDTAHIRFTWVYNKTAGPDNLQLKLFGCDIDGTYTASAGGGRIMGSIAGAGGLSGPGGIAGQGGGLAG